MINDGLGSFPSDGGAEFKKLFWVFWLCHNERRFPSTAFARPGAGDASLDALPIPRPAPEKDITIPPSFRRGQAKLPARNVQLRFLPGSNAALLATVCRSCGFPNARRNSQDSGHFSNSAARVEPRNRRTKFRRNTVSHVPRKRLDTAGPYRPRPPPAPSPKKFFYFTKRRWVFLPTKMKTR